MAPMKSRNFRSRHCRERVWSNTKRRGRGEAICAKAQSNPMPGLPTISTPPVSGMFLNPDTSSWQRRRAPMATMNRTTDWGNLKTV